MFPTRNNSRVLCDSACVFVFAGMSKTAYIEAVLNGVDSAITECQHKIFVRYTVYYFLDLAICTTCILKKIQIVLAN